MRKNNQNVWNTAETVDDYKDASGLFQVEEIVFSYLHNKFPDFLSNADMLDIGVGTGRTTAYFLPQVKSYVGIDYAGKMISLCQQRFSDVDANATFFRADARDLSPFPHQSFDFILFSYNGIDYVSHEDRRQVFQEVKRVGKNGTFFCFSTHNIRKIPDLFSFSLTISKFREKNKTFKNLVPFVFKRIKKYIMIRKLNESLHHFRHANFVEIRDGSGDFQLETCYVKPEFQVNELQKMGFKEILVFSLKKDVPLSKAEIAVNTDSWLYYLMTISK